MTQNALESGTASTVIVNRDVDLKVFDGIVYHQRKAEHLAKEELVMTGSPHSRNSSQTTGLGLSLEAGPSATGV